MSLTTFLHGAPQIPTAATISTKYHLCNWGQLQFIFAGVKAFVISQMLCPSATTICGSLSSQIASLSLFKCCDLQPQQTVAASGHK